MPVQHRSDLSHNFELDTDDPWTVVVPRQYGGLNADIIIHINDIPFPTRGQGVALSFPENTVDLEALVHFAFEECAACGLGEDDV
jgi:hypothetical protein